MTGDAFCVMLFAVAFVVGLAFGLYIAEQRNVAARKGKPVSDTRMRKLWVIDPLLERGPLLEHQFVTIDRRERER